MARSSVAAAPAVFVPPDTWVPKVLSEYEIGRALAAIETVSLLEKPIAELGCRAANLSVLEDDLRGCLELSKMRDVRFWTRPLGSNFRFGFYREPWALDALDFLDRAELDEMTRAWISGLLFGYRSSAIQQYISRLEHASPTRIG